MNKHIIALGRLLKITLLITYFTILPIFIASCGVGVHYMPLDGMAIIMVLMLWVSFHMILLASGIIATLRVPLLTQYLYGDKSCQK